MTQPAVPGSADWQRQWTIDAVDVLLQPVTRRIAEDVLAGGPITRTFKTGSPALQDPPSHGSCRRHVKTDPVSESEN